MSRFAVIGLGSFGMGLAHALVRLGAQVTAIDNERAHVEDIKDYAHTAIRMDARDRIALEEQGIHEVDCAIVCMGEDFEASELCAVHLLDLGCPRVIVRGTSRERVEILRALGPEVIQSAMDSARELAVLILSPGLKSFASFFGAHDLALVEVPDSLEGAMLGSLALEEKHKVKALAARHGVAADCPILTGLGQSHVLRAGDHLVLMGMEMDLIRAGRMFAPAE